MKTVRVAVTGLRRSGKTVFITSLVHQLCNRKDDSMMDFPVKKGNWEIRAEVLPLPKGVRYFPYENNLQELRKEPPEWPKITNEFSEIHLKILYKKPSKQNWNALKLEIVDYPGEWLPDLQMLHLPFHEWSRKMITLSQAGNRCLYSHDWFQLLQDIKVSEPIKDDASHLVAAYIDYLFACEKYGAGLTDLQPGHFLKIYPYEKAERLVFSPQPIVNFCPLPIPDSFQKSRFFSKPPETLFDEFERRYAQFQQEYIYPFYKKCFRGANVQVVLLDVLNILNWGIASYNEHRNCIEGVLKSFNYGHIGKLLQPIKPLSKYLPTFLPLEKIEKTIFIATKADHAVPHHHENMISLVGDLVDKAKQVALGQKSNSAISQNYVSSIRSTDPFEMEVKGNQEIRLKGIVLEEREKGLGYWRAMDVPARFPDEEEWITSKYHSYRFRPRKFPAKDGMPVPHINLDQVLGEILREYL